MGDTRIRSKERVVYFDILNIAATFGVILLHCNGLAHTYSDTLAWYQALLVEVLIYWPVPIFFMLSGATLIGYRERYTTVDFFKKRIMRTLIPFVIWSIISAIIKGINPFEIGLISFYNKFITIGIENVYWFFIPLFSVYLSMPVISLLAHNRRILWYMAGGSFLISSFVPLVIGYMGFWWNYSLTMLTCGGYLMYAILGYLLATEELSKPKRVILYLLGLFGAVLRYTMTVLGSRRNGVIYKGYFSYTAYYAVFLAVAVFLLAKNSRLIEKIKQCPRCVSIIKTISGCSFGIYLSHMIIRTFLGRYLPSNCWEWRLLVPFLIYAIGLVGVWVLKKIPVLKHIVP